ncbi:MAG: YtxH domain-containing protein [Gemmatimonadales bacterium]
MPGSEPTTDAERVPEAKDGASSALPWFLLGLGLGAGLALLFAPESGEDARAAVRKRVRALRDVAEEQFEGARETVVDRLGRAADSVANDDDDDEEDRTSTSTAREALKRRLRAARARRHPAASGGDAEGEGSPS